MLKCKIDITLQPDDGTVWNIPFAIDLDIVKSADNIMDTASFSLPLNCLWDGSKEVPDFTQSYVRIELGYDDNLYPVFCGYVNYMQFDNRVTFHCCSEAFKYKFRDLKLPSAGGAELYGFSFPDILKNQGVTEKIVTDMRDKPWYFELQPGSIFGLFEYLKRQRINCSIINNENDDSLFVISRRYPVALDRGLSFKRGLNIIDFKDAVVKKDLADDYQYNLDAVIARHYNFPVDLSKVSRDSDGNLQGLPPSDAVIAVQWPEWRGRKFDIQFWGVPWDAECALECHDAAIRSSVRRGEFELASLLAFGTDFVEPYEKVSVSWLSEVDGEYVCVSNRISFSPDKGIRQFMRLFSPLPLPISSDIKAQFNYLNR